MQVGKFKRLERRVIGNGTTGQDLVEQYLDLRDQIGHSRFVQPPVWQTIDGKAVFSSGESHTSSQRYVAEDNTSIRAWHTGHFVDVAIFEAGLPSGHGWRIHEEEWPSSNLDQIALLNLTRLSDASAFSHQDEARLAINELIDGTPGSLTDWSIKLDLSAPDVLNMVAPKTQKAAALLKAQGAVFSSGRQDWSLSKDEYLQQYEIIDLSIDGQIALQEMAGRNYEQAVASSIKGAVSVFADVENPNDFVVFRKPTYFENKEPKASAVLKDGLLHVFDGEEHTFKEIVSSLSKRAEIRRYSQNCKEKLSQEHAARIRAAIEKKLPVPAEVFDDYPHMRKYLPANMAGDFRPLPEFGSENDFEPIETHEIGEAIWNAEREAEQEDFYCDWTDQIRCAQLTQESLIETHAEDFYKPTRELLELAESASFADETRRRIEEEFRIDNDIADNVRLDNEQSADLYDLIADALVDELKEVAREDVEHDAWTWEVNDDNHDLYWETFYDHEYELIRERLEDGFEGAHVIAGFDEQEIADYAIMRTATGDYYVYCDVASHQAERLCETKNYDDAVRAAVGHARYGTRSVLWPLNESHDDTSWRRTANSLSSIRIISPSGTSAARRPSWVRGDFALVSPFSGQPGHQVYHLPTGVEVGQVWGTEDAAKRFVDLLRPQADWAKLTHDNLPDYEGIVQTTQQQAGRQAAENMRVMRSQQRNRLHQQPVKKLAGFAGPVAFSANLLDTEPPRFDLDKHARFEPTEQDKNWFVSRIRENAFESHIAENWHEENIESYTPSREALRSWASATYWKWHQLDESERETLLEHMANDDDVKDQLIFTELADEFEQHLGQLADAELAHFAHAIVLTDLSGQGYRAIFREDDPTDMEVFAPGPISDETFLGYARGETAMDALEDAHDIGGQYALRGVRAIDGEDLFKELNPQMPDDRWTPRLLILSEKTPCPSRLAQGFARGSFGLVRTDWHLGEKQPGTAVIHLATGLPIKPFFRRDQDAMAFAELIEKKADWHDLIDHEDFARESANLRNIARQTSNTIRLANRIKEKAEPVIRDERTGGFAGAVAFKALDHRHYEKNILGHLESADPSLQMSQKWDDFLTLSRCAFLGASMPKNSDAWRENENQYLDVVDRYRQKRRLADIREAYPAILAEVTNAANKIDDDVLGNLHMQIAPNSALGQEFTPYSIARLMSEITTGDLTNKQRADLLDGKSYVSMTDPACGAGVMAIAKAEALNNRHIDPKKHLRAHLTDIDRTACDMAYLNMSLRGIPAVVSHGNTLSLEQFSKPMMTPAYVKARYEDILNKRSAIQDASHQFGGLLDDEAEVQFSTGHNYHDLSRSLQKLGAGPDLMEHTFVPSNDPAPGVPGEYTRLQDVKDLLWHANLVFDAAEKFGFSEPHPEREALPPHKLYDDYHKELGSKVGAFLDNLELAHPTTLRQAQPLLDRVADYENRFDAYCEHYGEPDITYEALTTPRWKTGDTVPFFNPDAEMTVAPEDLPDDGVITARSEELYPFYSRQVKAEYLSRYEQDFSIDENYIAALAHEYKDQAIARLEVLGHATDPEDVEGTARAIVREELEAKGFYSGDIDTTRLLNHYENSIFIEAESRARDAAFEELHQAAPRSIADDSGLGYQIWTSPSDSAFKLKLHGIEVTQAATFAEAQVLAIAHAQGKDVVALRDSSRPLNPEGPQEDFARRDYIFVSGPEVRPGVFVINKLDDALVHGKFAISRSLSSKPGWHITHLPTGFSCNALRHRFASEQAAKSCVLELEKVSELNVTRADAQSWINAPENQDTRRSCFELIENHILSSIDAGRQERLDQARSNGSNRDARIAGPVAFKSGFQDTISPENADLLKNAFEEKIAEGYRFKSARELRDLAAQRLGIEIRGADPLSRTVEEIAEQAMVATARQIYENHAGSTADLIDKMSDLQSQLPNFAKRTSRSVELQSYSTPLTIAALVNRLLGAKPGETVYDPTAGNGALLIGQRPEDRVANEIDPTRLRGLQARHKWNFDAANGKPPREIDHLVANPPFGALSEGQGKVLYMSHNGLSPIRYSGDPVVSTSRLHHAIIWQGLTSLPADGRAVLILPSVRAFNSEERAKAYDEAGLRRFHWKLYDTFNVVDHVTLSGDLYRQQGASWPVDIIVVNGKGKSNLPLPTLTTPPVIHSIDQLKEICNAFENDSNKLDRRTSFSGIAKFFPDGIPSVWDSNAADRDKKRHPGDLSESSSGEAGRDRNGSSRSDRDDRKSNPSGIDGNGAGRADGLSGISSLAGSPDVDPAGNTADEDTQRPNNAGSGRGSDGAVGMSDTLVQYNPLSAGKPLDTLMPANLVDSFDKAKQRLLRAVGDIDDFVQEKLGYANHEELYNALSAEQIDATAFAIHQHETGASFINGHLMGIGKGRVAAAMLVYAHLNGLTPVFITERPNLYPAIMRDLTDIGYGHLRPLITNDGLSGAKALDLPDGRRLSTPNKAVHDAELIRIRNQGHLGKDYDFVMTTWAQTQTVQGQETLRRMLLQRLSRNALLVRDESHNGGGQDQLFKKPGPPNRAEFARELMWDAKGVYDSSATWAKAPHTMDLYGRTDLRHAVRDPKEIGNIISQHGLPMQQMVSSMLSESGQYMRLERAMTGIKYDFEVVDIDDARFDRFAEILEAIAAFDNYKQDLLAGDLGNQIKAAGESALPDGATGEIGINSVNFTSLLHNIAQQAELSLMADTVADKAIEGLKNGEKPFITLANTMGAFLTEFAASYEMQPGDAIDANFGDVLKRYLDRSRDVTIGTPFSEKERIHLSDAQLGSKGIALYDAVVDLIAKADWTGMPVSPIDHIKSRIEKAGYTFGEFTGRAEGIDYSGDVPVYYRRSAAERSKAADVRTETAFNNGSLDAVLGNESVASGTSLHASATFADQRPRLDITAQAHPDVTKHVQMKGRVNRTGQVTLPRYLHLLTNIPAAKRQAARLEQKLRSLNANTTANQSSLLQSGGVDFLNEIGDRAAATVMENNPAIHRRFGFPLKLASGARGLEIDGAARKVTGRMIMLPIKLQEKLFDEFETEFKAEHERAERLGLLRDEARVLDLDARELGQVQLTKSTRAESPFGGPVHIKKMDVRNSDKPYPFARVLAETNRSLGLPEDTALPETAKSGRAHAAALKDRIGEQFLRYAARSIDRANPRRRQAVEKRLNGDRQRFEKLIGNFHIGSSVLINTPDGKDMYGVVGGLKKRGQSVNPVAPSAWTVQIYVANGAKEIELRLNELCLPGEKALAGDYTLTKASQASQMVDGKLRSIAIPEAFDVPARADREERLIATGNVLAAADQFRDAQVLYFTTADGSVQPGLLLPRGTELKQVLSHAQVPLTTLDHVRRYLDEGGVTVTTDNALALIKRKDQIELRANRARSSGGKYWLDRDFRQLTGDFVSSGTSMVANISSDQLSNLFALMEDKKINLRASDKLAEARIITGAAVPEMTEKRVSKEKARALASEGRFVMPWELRGEAQAPFARSLQFSSGRPVALREEEEGGLVPVRHAGAPGPQPDGSRIHRILDVPDYVSEDQLLSALHLEADAGRFVHRFNNVYYSTGTGDNGLTIYNDDQVKSFPAHHQYDTWAMRRGAAPAGWTTADVPLLSPSGPVRYPGFIHPDAPGLAVVPFPRPGLRPGSFDSDSLRFVVLHKESGQALLPGNRFMYTAQGAAAAALKMAKGYDFKNLISPDQMSRTERAHANKVLEDGYSDARSIDRDAYIEHNLKQGVSPEFSKSDIYWLVVDDAADPDIDLAAEMSQTSGCFYLYPDRDLALDIGMEDAAPVRAHLGRIADLTVEPWAADVRAITEEFFNTHEDMLKLGLSTTYYDIAHEFEVVRDRVDSGEDEDKVIAEFVSEKVNELDYTAFEDAIRRQDYVAAGNYDGDLKDALMAWLSDKFDGVKLWEPYDYDQKELVIFNARDVELAWDQLETSIEMARREKAEHAERTARWEQERGEAEIERLKDWKAEQKDTFDLAVLQERGYNVNDVHWLSVPNKEYPELEKAYANSKPELFTRRTDAQSDGLFDEAVPVYLRRGNGVDLTSDNPTAHDFLAQLAQTPGLAAVSLANLPGGDIDESVISAVTELAWAKGLDFVQFNSNGTKRTLLADTSDVSVAWDAIERKSIYRRATDTMVGPALAAAQQAAALEAPRLLLTGPEGREAAEADSRLSSIFMQAEEVRRLAGNDALLIFIENDKAQIFDRDAKRAFDMIETLPLVEIGDIAEIEVSAQDVEQIAATLAGQHRVVIARLDDNRKIALESFSGNQREIETLSIEDIDDPQLRQERESKRARQRASAWTEKPITDRYADLHLAARNREVPALIDGDRYVIAGLLARQLSDDVPLLKTNFEPDQDITSFKEADIPEVTAKLASLNKRLMLAEGLSRATWRQARVGSAAETEAQEEISAQSVIERHAELAKRHPDRVVFVEDGEGFRTFGANVETIAKADPQLTSKFEKVHNVGSIAIDREEMDYQARQMTLRGLKVSVAAGLDGNISLKNFDPQTEVVRDSDISTAISGENKDAVVSARKITQTEQDLEDQTPHDKEGGLAALVRVFDEQKTNNPAPVFLVQNGDKYVLFDGDARLVARHFEPVRNQLGKFLDDMSRVRVSGTMNNKMLERAIEQLRNRSIDLVVLKQQDGEYLAESHAATRQQPDYPAVEKDAAARRGFDLTRKMYAPVSPSGAFVGRPMIDGIAYYNDPIAAGHSQIEVHVRVKNMAKLTSTELNGYGWRANLLKMVENLKESYGIETPEQLRDILADGRVVSWWENRLAEQGIGGDPLDLRRSIFSELRKLGFDGALMLDEYGYEVGHAFDPESVIPVNTIALTHQKSSNLAETATSSLQNTGMNRFGQSMTTTPESKFVPNRFGFDGLKLAYQATPQSREELKHVLDEITRAFDSEESTGDKRSSYLREIGLLNGTLAGRINRYTDEVHPISPGYVLYPADNGKWVYATIRDFVSATGPRGSLYGRWAPEMSDQISDYAAFYLNQLDAAFEPQLARIKEELTELVGEINPDVDLRFVDRLFADGTIEGNPDRQPVLGLYFRHTDAMPISTDISKGDPRLTGLHELYHSLVPLLTPEEQRVIMSGFGGEERAAEAFAQWALGTGDGQRLGPLRNLFERMNNILQGNGFRSWQDVFRQTRTGEVARRAKVLEMSSDLTVEMAKELAEAANLPALGDAIMMYGRRLKSDMIPMETVYQMMAQHLDDMEITRAATRAGYHRISDEQNISSIPATRMNTIALDLARHQKLTPIDIGSSDPYIARRSEQGSPALARRSPAGVRPQPSIRRRMEQPRVIRYKTEKAEILQNNLLERTSTKSPLASNIKDIMLQDDVGLILSKSPQYLQHNAFIGNNGGTLDMIELAGQETTIPMATRGSANIIDANARPLFVVPGDMDKLVERQIVGSDERGLHFDAVSGAYYVTLDHPEAGYLLENYGTIEAREKWLEHRSHQEAGIAQTLSEFQVIARQIPEEDRLYIYPIGESEVQMARLQGARFDERSDYRLYYVDKHSPQAETLSKRFGVTEERMHRYADWRERQFNEKIRRQNVAYIDTAESEAELGPNVVRKVGRSALFSAGIGGAAAAATQIQAAEAAVQTVPNAPISPDNAGEIEAMFERMDDGQWREIVQNNSFTDSAQELWQSLSADTQQFFESMIVNAGPTAALAKELISEKFDQFYSALTAFPEKLANSSSADEFFSHVKSQFYTDMHTISDFAASAGEAVRNITPPDVSFAPGLSELKTSVVDQTLPGLKAQVAGTMDSWMQGVKSIAQPAIDVMQNTLGPKVTAAVAAIGGTAGLSAVASGAVTAGTIGAGVAAATYMARRGERRKMWADDSREMPWKLTSRQFGQVFKKHYAVERHEENGVETLSLKRKGSEETIFKTAAPLGAKVSARELVQAAHGAMVDKAIEQKLPVPDQVKLSVVEARARSTGQGYANIETGYLGASMGDEMRKSYVEKVPSVVAGTDTKGLSEQLARLPLNTLASASLKTAQAESLTADPAKKGQLSKGMDLLQTEIINRARKTADQRLAEGMDQKQKTVQRSDRTTKPVKRKGRGI